MTGSPTPGAGGVGRRLAVQMFLAFAFTYFFSALLRAITATLAPTFSGELGLGAGDLGLMAGAYFLGFAATQLPLGSALDRYGPKRVLLALLTLAVLGCVGFAAARNFGQMLLARLLIGLGVSACLMAPLTSFRHRFGPSVQLRANSWMLMTGSLGMLASTLPVQWLLPLLGWRGLFAALAMLLLLSQLLIQAAVPVDAPAATHATSAAGGYREVFGHPGFQSMAPLAFCCYGGMVAMQSLWIGPWLTQVAQRSPAESAQGLFLVNFCMLLAFLCWGLAMPRLDRAGWRAERIIATAWPGGVLALGWIVAAGPAAGAGHWALWCVLTSVVSLSQPAVAQAFPARLAGRALSAFNLVIFAGVFTLQWGIGLLIDGLRQAGWSVLEAYRMAFGLFLAACALSFAWMWWRGRNALAPSRRSTAARG
ncbi:MFS transporter [Aquabacterium sp.]|uniref:MFS transporter n=1 Tax=Aquabacterium sp. TaxID=1872578 RepID=UPI003782ED7D